MSAKEKSEPISGWLIASPDGSVVPSAEFDWSGHDDLRAFFGYESAGSREANEAPAHVKMMQKMELVNYEPSADSGNFRWLPRGHLIKRLMERRVSDIVRDYGGMQVETPIMYDLKHPQLASYLERFPAKQYHLLSGSKKFFLRFAACFGQYMIMHDMKMSHSHLPVRMYELTHNSFRRESAGSLAGLRRLRGFTMPDMHSVCLDSEQAKEEFRQQYLLCKQWMSDLGYEHVMAIRIVDDFYQQNKQFIADIIKDFGRPILLEVWKERYYYFVLKFEFNIIDGQGKAAALSTVQIDVENAERFDITYVDEDGQKKYPLILHASVSGSVDRNLYAMLEQQGRKMNQGGIGELPYWLNPAQVRLLPVADRHLEKCLEIAAQLPARVEIDDRKDTVGHKIREAGVNWVPFVCVVGDQELGSNRLSVNQRGIRAPLALRIDELKDMLVTMQGDKPYEALSWPKLLSKQPHFS